MQNLEFNIHIESTPEKVWKCLWELENYKKWTNVFCEGSYYKVSDFKQGNKIHLLTPSGDGMFSIIDVFKEYKLLVFKHLGELKNFEEQPLPFWTNAIESYQLIPNENGVKLKVNVDTLDEYVDFMQETFQLALLKLKELVLSN
jgi:hypothetical protein